MFEAGTTQSDAIDIILRRHKDGIRLTVHTTREVEEFFQRWSGGLLERPQHGRLWKSGDDSPLDLWAFGLSNIGPSPSRPWTLLHSGLGFYTDQNYPNISFLRMAGVSEPTGRDLIIEALIGRGEIITLGQRLSDACNMFYNEYIQSVNIRAVVNVYQLPTTAAA